MTQLVKAATGRTPKRVAAEAGWVHRRVSPALAEQVRKAYLEDPRVSFAALQQRFGLNAPAIQAALADVRDDEVLRANPKSLRLTVDQMCNLISEYLSGMTASALTMRYGGTDKSLTRQLHNAGIPTRYRGRPRADVYLGHADVARVVALYREGQTHDVCTPSPVRVRARIVAVIRSAGFIVEGTHYRPPLARR